MLSADATSPPSIVSWTPRGRPHRTRFNNFVLVQRWKPEEALAATADRLLTALKPRPGDRIYLVIDHTEKAKRGGQKTDAAEDRPTKAMQAVEWIYDGSSGQKIRGHQFVCATIVLSGVQIPFGIRLYVKKEHCAKLGIPFKKTTQLAAELIKAFQPPKDVKITVLFDSYYLCPTVVKACRRKGFSFIAPLKSNRNLFRNGRP
ncbi:MAG: transposase [candidate division KSB1 bacterium]|nr:transposase [candidate division KSB1 bacterium]